MHFTIHFLFLLELCDQGRGDRWSGTDGYLEHKKLNTALPNHPT